MNIPDAVNVPSAAAMVWLPAAAVFGMVIVAENAPVPDEVTVVGLVVMLALSNVIVIVLLAPKLEPEIVTVVPVVPEVGDKVIAACGAVTVN